MLGVVLGGRIGYLLFYGWTQMQSDPLYIFRVWEGGMSFHGGFFGVIIVSYIYARRQGIGLDRLLDLGAAATPVGLGLGRLANFVNGELYGRETYLPWAFVFPMTLRGCRAIPASSTNFSLKGCCCLRSSITRFPLQDFAEARPRGGHVCPDLWVFADRG